MRLRKALLSSFVVSAIALALGGSPAAAEGDKLDPKGSVGPAEERVLAEEAAAAKKAGELADPKLEQALSVIQSRITEFVKANGPRYSFGNFIDPYTNRIVLQTDAPAEPVAELISRYEEIVDVQRATVADTFSRRDDIAPFWGGAGVTAAGAGLCSTGLSVRNGSGTRFMVTAGHCFTNGTNAITEIGGRSVGRVGGNGLPTQDMELIGGSSYGAAIYVGGVNSSTGNAVLGAGDPTPFFASYCHSGRTTGENCGHVVLSNFALVCTSSGCKAPVIAYLGGNQIQGGDSGSPFYLKSGTNVFIRGINIAGGGGIAFAEKWSRIAGRFGVSIAN